MVMPPSTYACRTPRWSSCAAMAVTSPPMRSTTAPGGTDERGPERQIPSYGGQRPPALGEQAVRLLLELPTTLPALPWHRTPPASNMEAQVGARQIGSTPDHADHSYNVRCPARSLQCVIRRLVTTVVEETGLEDEKPTLAHLGIDLTGAALPMEGLPRGSIDPQRVDVYDSERSIALLRDCNAPYLAIIMNQIMRLEELLPRAFPALAIKASERHDPGHRIVCRRVRRPGPHCVWMEKGDKGFGIACVPRGGLRVDHRSYFFFHRGHETVHSDAERPGHELRAAALDKAPQGAPEFAAPRLAS